MLPKKKMPNFVFGKEDTKEEEELISFFRVTLDPRKSVGNGYETFPAAAPFSGPLARRSSSSYINKHLSYRVGLGS